MATYVCLINWTEQGIKGFRDTTRRAENFSELVKGAGGTVRVLLWTVGKYDIVQVVEFPDEDTGVAALLELESAGNIRAHTMPAFNAVQMATIIERASIRREYRRSETWSAG